MVANMELATPTRIPEHVEDLRGVEEDYLGAGAEYHSTEMRRDFLDLKMNVQRFIVLSLIEVVLCCY